MGHYMTRPGVVLTTIGGRNILVAAKEARELCPYTAEINETAAFCWRILEQGTDFETLLTKLSAEYEIDDPAAVRMDLTELLAQLEKANYLISKP